MVAEIFFLKLFKVVWIISSGVPVMPEDFYKVTRRFNSPHSSSAAQFN